MPHDFLSLAFMAALGLAIGSFLNVLIHRLPIMIEQSWQDPATATEPVMDLAFPASHCPSCHHPIAWFDNLPLLALSCGHLVAIPAGGAGHQRLVCLELAVPL
jgi:leader peptidase (prepilin peptidase)/N-methyltransferase